MSVAWLSWSISMKHLSLSLSLSLSLARSLFLYPRYLFALSRYVSFLQVQTERREQSKTRWHPQSHQPKRQTKPTKTNTAEATNQNKIPPKPTTKHPMPPTKTSVQMVVTHQSDDKRRKTHQHHCLESSPGAQYPHGEVRELCFTMNRRVT